jgi:hypothetical protein
MYLGVYPRATIFEYEPAKPWNRTDPSEPNNPLRLGQLGSEQDCWRAMRKSLRRTILATSISNMAAS